MQELVDDLERRGIVNRQPDRRDGRAKLIVLTVKGLDALAPAGSIIEQLEREYADRIGDERFEDMCLALNTLIDHALRDPSVGYLGDDFLLNCLQGFSDPIRFERMLSRVLHGLEN